ncbi:hypothetical protein, partial [Accumulibacter sp.]|uniref:hypothetical protein n=1 Tax=Accumulibacter sp. TaxID=2053492 RepID=UPI002D12D3CA
MDKFSQSPKAYACSALAVEHAICWPPAGLGIDLPLTLGVLLRITSPCHAPEVVASVVEFPIDFRQTVDRSKA